MASTSETNEILQTITTNNVGDINDAFDNIFLSEDRIYKEEYKEGVKKGEEDGLVDGFHLGYHRGAEIGAEIGYYVGILEASLAVAKKENVMLSDNLTANIRRVLEGLKNFPCTNTDEVDIINLFETIKAQYKKLKLHKVVTFLEPYLPLTNSHLVNFITKQLWETIIPSSLREEVSALNDEHLLDLFCSIMTHKLEDNLKFENEAIEMYPSVFKFFKNANEMSLKHFSDITLPLEMLKKKLNSNYSDNANNVSGNVFMSPKKSHEVHAMTKVVSTLTKLSRATHVVDVGSGKGYLSSFLALEHGLQVLGIDSSHINTHGARIRTERMQKIRKNSKDLLYVERPAQEKNCENDISNNSEQYKQVTMFVTPQTNMTDLIKEHFNLDCTSVSLVGLHTCGDLASSCLRIFSENSSVSSLCNVGCCYNHLTEDLGTKSGFPMSHFLRSINFQLGRNSRMVAAQPLERIVNFKQIPVEPLLYRAMLEALLVDKFGNNVSWTFVGRLASKCTNFEEYVQNALKKINSNTPISKEEIAAIYNKFIVKKKELQAYFLFRIALAPVVETVILLDRLLYLKEQGIDESYLVSLFDPVISPRCYGIVALKHI